LLHFPALNGNRNDLDPLLYLLVEEFTQLTELTGAVGSPVASVEDKKYVLLAPEFREGHGLSTVRHQREVRREITDRKAVDFHTRQIVSIYRSKFDFP
jgi:hypothetical protein